MVIYIKNKKIIWECDKCKNTFKGENDYGYIIRTLAFANGWKEFTNKNGEDSHYCKKCYNEIGK